MKSPFRIWYGVVLLVVVSAFHFGCSARHIMSARQLAPDELRWGITADEFIVGPVRLTGTVSQGFENGDISAFLGSSILQLHAGAGGRFYLSQKLTVSLDARYRFLYAGPAGAGATAPRFTFYDRRGLVFWNSRITFGPGDGVLYGGIDSVLVTDFDPGSSERFPGWGGGGFIGVNWRDTDGGGDNQLELSVSPLVYTPLDGWELVDPSNPASFLQGVQFGVTITY